MSKKPEKWINQVYKYVDKIYIHLNTYDSTSKLINLIKEKSCKAGIVFNVDDKYEIIEPFLSKIDSVLVLAIPKPGHSGQKFDPRSLNHLSYFNKHKFKNKFELTVDGGVNLETVSKFDSDSVVSGSYVLNSNNPKKSIYILKTSALYENGKG